MLYILIEGLEKYCTGLEQILKIRRQTLELVIWDLRTQSKMATSRSLPDCSIQHPLLRKISKFCKNLCEVGKEIR